MLIAIAAVLVVIVGGATAYITLRAPTQKAAPTKILTINLPSRKISCIQDIEWSPDRRRIAVLGYWPACPFTVDTSQAVVGIFDATTGQQLYSFAADPLIAGLLRQLTSADATTGSALQVGEAASSPPTRYVELSSSSGSIGSGAGSVTFDTLAWSPDNRQLAISFTISEGHDPSRNFTQVINGVVLCDPSGQRARTLAHTTTFNESGGPTGLSGSGQSLLLDFPLRPRVKLGSSDLYSGEWDVESGAYIPAPANAALGYTGMALRTPALGYRWSANGALIPVTPLKGAPMPAVAASTPIGIADGSQTFMMWQPGLLNLRNHTQDGQRTIVFQPGLATLTTSFIAWSPDGQYLIDMSPGPWRIQPAAAPAPSRATLDAFGMAPFPTIPAHDATMSVLLRTSATDMTASSMGVNVVAAWSPNGRLLAIAAATPGGDQSSTTSDNVTLYDCATGQKLATLTPQGSYADMDGSSSSLRWSPDGSHLLYYDFERGAITIWGPSALPHA